MLSVGHGEYSNHCIWSCDPALPAPDNRITANWTLGFSLSLCFFCSPNHSIFPAAHVTASAAFSGIYDFSENHPLLFCLSPLSLEEREGGGGRDREEVGVKEKRRRQAQKRWMAVEQSDKEQERETNRESEERGKWDWCVWNKTEDGSEMLATGKKIKWGKTLEGRLCTPPHLS